MTGPIIDHLDNFEAAIVAIAMRNIVLDRAVLREVEASRRREEWVDWYAEERASRTGSA